MAYNCYFSCDVCGDEGCAWTNLTVSLSKSEKFARAMGWKITKKGWICPSCQKRLEKQKQKEKENDIR